MVDVRPMTSTTKPLSNSNTTSHTLTDMISRWVYIETFKWVTSNTVLPMFLTQASYIAGNTSFIKTYSLPQSILEASSLLRQKMNNFMLFKSDIEIDVKTNANPFQQGALLVAYFPKSLNTSKYRANASEFLASVTSAPHRILYLEHADSLTFRVPYANIIDYINLSNTDNEFGRLNIYVLSPLSGPTSAEAINVTVRMRFVNPILEAPTDNSLLLNTKYQDLERSTHTPKRKNTRIHGLRAQMGEGDAAGPVARVSGVIGSVASSLSSVPVIGGVATAVSWLARATGAVAAVFGWSKPTDTVIPSYVVNRPAMFMGNTEGKDYSNTLAQIPDNAIDPSLMIPNNEDEMAHATIFQRPNMIGRITVPKNLFTERRLLFSWEVSPFNYLTQQLDSNGKDLALGSFAYTSLLYKLWRGSISYSLASIKTGYHSGRIMAVYFPNRSRLDIPETYEELMTTNNNMIYDLQALTEDETSLSKPIVIPYTSERCWKKTLHVGTNGIPDASTLETSVGTIGIYCINELVCPETVAQEVTFLLSVKAGKDYELSMPQLQLSAGLSTGSPPVDVGPELIRMINIYMTTQFELYMTSAPAHTRPEFANGTIGSGPEDVVISQASTADADWRFLRGGIYPIDDGEYSATIRLDFTSGESYFTNGSYDFRVQMLDGLVDKVYSDPMITDLTITQNATVFIQASAVTTAMTAQMADEPGSDPIPDDEFIAPVMAAHNITETTVGEYSQSLRPLIKRFVHTRNIPTNQMTTLTPNEFNNFDSTSSNNNIGARAWTAGATGGGFLPESWLNAVSYLFRFGAGGVRSKVFINHRETATTSLNICETLLTDFTQKHKDPAFVQNGTVNNAMETTMPYYSQLRARTIGDELKGLGVRQNIYINSPRTGNRPYYEAAADDYSFWFLIGPPIMRLIDLNYTAPSTIAPTTP